MKKILLVSLIAWGMAMGTVIPPYIGHIAPIASHPDKPIEIEASIVDDIGIEEATAKVQFFVPDKFVPLSSFVEVNSNPFILPVNKKILRFLDSKKIKVVIQKNGTLTYVKPSNIDVDNGRIKVSVSENLIGGIATAVSPMLLNDFPIVTHWDQSLNSGKGSFRLGASDLLGIVDIDPITNQPIEETYVEEKEPSGDSPSYYYNVKDYALFEGDAKVPSYERYVGENYAINKITDRYAIWVSDTVLKKTGFPVVHRNYPLQLQSLLHNAPVFQVIHAWLIADKPDKPSLATFILPPFWPDSMPQRGYPVLFNGGYDIHGSCFYRCGNMIMSIIGEVFNSGKGSGIGILWNGGGARASRTVQRSAYDNAAILFDVAKDSFKINPEAIITFGGSRGGSTALRVAANPYYNNYKVVYALAWHPAVKVGEHGEKFQNTSYPALMRAIDWTTGYFYAWRLDWRDPVTGLSGRELHGYNLVGTTDYAYIDDFLTPASPFHLQALKNKGTRVLLNVGTHDVIMPFTLYFKYVKGLQDYGIPVRFEIFYRWGHTLRENVPDYLKYCLEDVLSGNTSSFPSGTFHYRRKDNDNPYKWEEFFPAYQPIFLEAPKACAKPGSISISIIGGKGIHYNLELWKIDDSLWKNHQVVKEQFIARRFQGIFPDSQFITEFLDSTNFDSGYYLYKLFFSEDGTDWIQIPSNYVPQPGEKGPPVFQILQKEPMITGEEVLSLLTHYCKRGWGLSGEYLVTKKPILYLKKQAPSTATSGSVITYLLTYKNTGTSSLENVFLIDHYPQGFTPIGQTSWKIGTLGPGMSGTVSLKGTVTATDPSGISAVLVNKAIIYGQRGSSPASITAYASATTYIIPINLPDLLTVMSIKTFPQAPVILGKRVGIISEIKNTGNKLATNIKVRFFDDDRVIGDRYIRSLYPGQTVLSAITTRFTYPGTHAVKVFVDFEDTIPEISEKNNILTIFVPVIVDLRKGIITGTVTDKRTNMPIPRALVRAYGGGYDFTDSTGKYTIYDLKPRTYTVGAFKSGYYPHIKSVGVRPGQITVLCFELTPQTGTTESRILSIPEGESSLDAMITSAIYSLKEREDLPHFPDKEIAITSNQTIVKLDVSEGFEIGLNVNGEIFGGSIKLDYDRTKVGFVKIESIPSASFDKELNFAQEEPSSISLILFFKAISDNPDTTIKIILEPIDNQGQAQEEKIAFVTIESATPQSSILLQSFPNPGEGSIWIPFKLSEDGNVTLEIYNILGQRIRTIEVGERKAGSYTQAKEGRAILWDRKNNYEQNVSSGLYFYQLKAGKFSATKSMVVK